jgi:hypothetical protein
MTMEYPVTLTLELESLHMIRHALADFAASFTAVDTRDYVKKHLAIKEQIETAIQAWIKGE